MVLDWLLIWWFEFGCWNWFVAWLPIACLDWWLFIGWFVVVLVARFLDACYDILFICYVGVYVLLVGWVLLNLYCCAYCFLLDWLTVCFGWLCFSLVACWFRDLWFCLLLELVGIFDCDLDGYVACRYCVYVVVLFGFA